MFSVMTDMVVKWLLPFAVLHLRRQKRRPTCSFDAEEVEDELRRNFPDASGSRKDQRVEGTAGTVRRLERLKDS